MEMLLAGLVWALDPVTLLVVAVGQLAVRRWWSVAVVGVLVGLAVGLAFDSGCELQAKLLARILATTLQAAVVQGCIVGIGGAKKKRLPLPQPPENAKQRD